MPFDPDATIIFGASIDENMGDTIRVTVIATGIDDTNGGSIKAPKPAPFTKPETPQSRFTKAAEKRSCWQGWLLRRSELGDSALDPQ